MFEKIIIAPGVYLFVAIIMFLSLPWLLWLAWGHIMPLKKVSKGIEFDLRGSEK